MGICPSNTVGPDRDGRWSTPDSKKLLDEVRWYKHRSVNGARLPYQSLLLGGVSTRSVGPLGNARLLTNMSLDTCGARWMTSKGLLIYFERRKH